MLYVRTSLMRPKPGHGRAIAEIMDDLVSFYAKQPGYVLGYKLASADDLGDIGRVTVWRSQDDADAAARITHVMSKRADLQALIEENSHVERSFHAEDESQPLARLLKTRRL